MIDSQPTVLSLTDATAAKLHDLTKEETNPAIGLRVYVYSGGCSGYRYGMMLEDAPTDEDRTFEANGVKVYVDMKSHELLAGTTIDFVVALDCDARVPVSVRHVLRGMGELFDGTSHARRSPTAEQNCQNDSPASRQQRCIADVPLPLQLAVELAPALLQEVQCQSNAEIVHRACLPARQRM